MPTKETVKKAINNLREKKTLEKLSLLNKELYEALIILIRQAVSKWINDNVETIRGTKGDRGESIVGSQGEKGEKGDSIVGPQGIPGKDGKTPIAGVDFPLPKDGKDGEPGKDGIGIPGRDGANGSPDTPDQVVEKVNSADKKVTLSAIEGLLQEIQDIKQAIRQKSGGSGGGGMGNVIAETPTGTVNGANVTFTLTSTPKSNSLILLQNGQFMRNGASFEYTLSGKTITLNVAPVTNEQMFAYYIRT